MSGVSNRCQEIAQGTVFLDGGDVDTRYHHLTNDTIVEAENTLDHVAFAFLEDSCLTLGLYQAAQLLLLLRLEFLIGIVVAGNTLGQCREGAQQSVQGDEEECDAGNVQVLRFVLEADSPRSRCGEQDTDRDGGGYAERRKSSIEVGA